MSQIHVFFESLDAWLTAKQFGLTYGMPFVQTRPSGQGFEWKESKILLSQPRHDDIIHHCLFLVARHLDPMDRDKQQEHADRLDRAWTSLKTLLEQQHGLRVYEGMVAYPRDLGTIDAYLPASLLKEDHHANDEEDEDDEGF